MRACVPAIERPEKIEMILLIDVKYSVPHQQDYNYDNDYYHQYPEDDHQRRQRIEEDYPRIRRDDKRNKNSVSERH